MKTFKSDFHRGDHNGDGERLVRVFASGWGLVHLAHFLRHPVWFDSTGHVFTLSALLVALFPTSRVLLAVMATLQLLVVIGSNLYVDNHAVIMAIVNLSIVVVMALRLAQETVVSAFRVVGSVAYSFAALAKLNGDFLMSSESCAIDFLGRTQSALERFGGVNFELPQWLLAVAPWMVAAAEISVPILLVVPRLRWMAAVVVVPLHLSMSINPFGTGTTFTVLVLLLVLVFQGPAAIGYVASVADGANAWLRSRRLLTVSSLMVVAATVVITSYGPNLTVFTPVPGARNHTPLAMVGLVMSTFVLLAVLRKRAGRSRRGPNHARVGFVPVAFGLLTAAWAMSPYIGLGTVPVFTMYSNLTTEAGRWNHLLVPPMRFFSTQDHVVTGVRTPDGAAVGALLASGFGLTMHEYRRLFAVPNGTPAEPQLVPLLPHGEPDDPRLHQPLTPLGGFFVHHRRVDLNPEVRCQW